MLLPQKDVEYTASPPISGLAMMTLAQSCKTKILLRAKARKDKKQEQVKEQSNWLIHKTSGI